jgi:hypothetical protein
MPGGAPHVRREVVSCAEQARLWPKLNGGANRRPPLATVIATRQREFGFHSTVASRQKAIHDCETLKLA